MDEKTYYTEEELAVLNGASQESIIPPESVVYNITAPTQAEKLGETLQNIQESQQNEKTVSGIEVVRAAIMIVTGVMFTLIPLSMIFPLVTVTAADGGFIGAIPITMLMIFIVVGSFVLIRGIGALVSAVINKK